MPIQENMPIQEPTAQRSIAAYLKVLLPLGLVLGMLVGLRHLGFGGPIALGFWYWVPDAMGAAIALMGWGMMVYAQRRCEFAEAKNEHRQRFLRVLEDIELIAVIVDSQGTIGFCNDYLLDVCGWQRNRVLGRNWFELFVPENEREHERVRIEQAVATGHAPAAHESRILTRNRQQRLIAWNTTVMLDAQGRAVDFTCIGEDITERRHGEDQLRKLSRAVEQSASIVVITDDRGSIEYVNPKFTQVTGYSLAELSGCNPRTLKSGETSQEEYQRLWQTITGGGEWRGEFHNKKKSGEMYWESASISPIRNASGSISHFIAVKEDITERKRLEAEVQARNLDLLKHRELSAIGRLANMVAHDLRNPLSSVKMALQILHRQAHSQLAHISHVHPAAERCEECGLGEQTRELTQIAMDQVRYMEAILTDLMTYSRPDALKPEWINLDKLLDTTLSSLQKQIGESGVAIRTHYQAGVPTVHADPMKLRQAFSNLIVNAVQASEGRDGPAPEVAINVHLALIESGARVQIEVLDNGPGVAPEMAGKLFEPFFTTRAKGTGLGLAIVKRIVDQHGGDVALENLPGQGARAVVTLSLGQLACVLEPISP